MSMVRYAGRSRISEAILALPARASEANLADPRIAALEQRFAELEQQFDIYQLLNRVLVLEAMVQQLRNDVRP